jgi:hypothetical protein
MASNTIAISFATLFLFYLLVLGYNETKRRVPLGLR